MKQRSSSVGSWLGSALGLAPLAGAVASAAWMLAFGAQNSGVAAVTMVLVAVVLLQGAYSALQSVLWFRYRPFVAPPNPKWPRISVVIPAFNEGPMVERSIRSVARSDYPAELLEIIVVDDGSRDDTFFHMRHLRCEHPELVRLLRFSGNRGKRAALEAGFEAAIGDIVVTIDSDSEVEPDTLREIATPFLVDPKIGAVAGRVAVLNRDSLISRMLEVQYALAFDFGRAAQSVYRAVAVCPGALSAFRREVILPHLPEWSSQTFLGKPVNHGEDQALTNIVLRLGYDTVYQRSAVINTLAPTTYGQLSKMFVRWDRSYIVEGLSFAKFMLTRYRDRHRVLPVIGFVIGNLRLAMLFFGLATLPMMMSADLSRVLHASAALLVGAAFSACYYLRLEKSPRFLYGVVYAAYSFLLLQWILPWALLTVRDERWGTR
ncbi:MAG: glycosyltransferase [Polyangiaceae bacterium]|nr:glycosyltransferase [Polyangiaceae bacterium]